MQSNRRIRVSSRKDTHVLGPQHGGPKGREREKAKKVKDILSPLEKDWPRSQCRHKVNLHVTLSHLSDSPSGTQGPHTAAHQTPPRNATLLLQRTEQGDLPKCLHAQSCPTLCNPMDCSLPGSSVHGILLARTLEWIAIPFCKGSSNTGIEPRSLTSPALAGQFFTTSTTQEAEGLYSSIQIPCQVGNVALR